MPKRLEINKDDYPMVIDWTSYENTKSKVTCICEKCNKKMIKYFSDIRHSHSKRCWCIQCSNTENNKREINKNLYPMVLCWDNYDTKALSKLLCKCNQCGKKVYRTLKSIDRSNGVCKCDCCTNKSRSKKHVHIIEHEKYPMVIDWTGYKNKKSKVTCRCDNCGTSFKRALNNIKTKNGLCTCQKCKLKGKRNPSYIVVNREDYPMVVCWNNYDGKKKKLLCKCAKCGKVAKRSLSDIDRTITNCDCENPGTSKGEMELKDFITTITPNNYKYRIGKFEIDMYIPELKIGFEYNGNYWHSYEILRKRYEELHDKENYFKKLIKKYPYLDEFFDNIDDIAHIMAHKYHAIKDMIFLKHNIKIYHIWEVEWKSNNIKVKNKIREIIKNHQLSN